MKKLLCILLCVAVALVMFACASEVEQAAEPTPELQAGESFDRHRERVTCRVDENEKDTKDTWKVKSPTESPDPSWVVEEVDGDVVTYSKTYCDHIKIGKKTVPCPINSEDTHEQLYYTMLEETANRSGFGSNYEVVSNENGIVTYKSSVECTLNLHRYKHMKETDEIPCQLCPEFIYNGETIYVYDTKWYLKVLASLEDREKPSEGYTYEYTEGEWDVYSYIECDDMHATYAEKYGTSSEKAEE